MALRRTKIDPSWAEHQITVHALLLKVKEKRPRNMQSGEGFVDTLPRHNATVVCCFSPRFVFSGDEGMTHEEGSSHFSRLARCVDQYHLRDIGHVQ